MALHNRFSEVDDTEDESESGSESAGSDHDDEVPVDSQYPTSLTVLALLQDSAGNAKWDQMRVVSEEASSSTASKWKRVSCKGGAARCSN